MLSDVGKLFPVLQQRQPQRDVVVRTAVTFRPTEALLKTIVRRGLLRQGKEKINLSTKHFKSLFIPAIAYGVTWGKMRNLYRFIQSIPLEIESGKECRQLKPLGTRMKFSKTGGSAKFKNFGMKIWLPCRRCRVGGGSKQCGKIVFRRNKCNDRSHRCVVAHHCRFHEKQLGCGLCLEEEDEDEEEEICWNCGEEPFFCEDCSETFCMYCGEGYHCDYCDSFFCDDCVCDCDDDDDDDDD